VQILAYNDAAIENQLHDADSSDTGN